MRVVEGHAGFAGLTSCGSVWVCPVCSSKVMARRAIEIGLVVAAAQAQGLSVAFLTLTMRHHRGDRLELLWDALAKGWGRATGGKSWMADVDEFGVLGYVRAVECTIGANGWHLHVHALVVAEHLTSSGVDRLADSMHERWSAGVVSKGLRAPLRKASEAHLVTGATADTALGRYLAKGVESAAALGMELTQTQSKVARSVNSTLPVWSLLDGGALDGETDPLRLWHEWERGSKGRRQIAWSRGLRKLLGLTDRVLSDEEIAAEELGSRDDTVVVITRAGWGSLVRRPWLIPEVLNVAESQNTEGLSTWLHLFAIEHRRA